ncbi:MAG: bi-domain-containing oxidoreductase [Gammaproteobacteria bacterium]
MKQVLLNSGRALVEEVPAPLVEPGTVLVRVSHSCISVGTEMYGLVSSGTPLWKKALKDPWKVRKALELVATRGIGHTTSVVRGELNAGSPTGYSATGEVIAVGEGVMEFEPGDRVACAGAQCAHHAEIIRVPVNLSVPVPEGVSAAAASTVTLGAIAMQGVRRAEPTLGETFVVVGLGILGQITVQLLRANGCRVIGMDLDNGRVDLAESLGMDHGVRPDSEVDVGSVARLTGGVGADGVIVTAAAPDKGLLSTAFKMCRRKGRVVLVGDVPIQIDRADIYRNELEFLISTSYGPGRYDERYEEGGLDYPVAYVRWTENRNLSEYLRLIADGRMDVEPLIGATYPLDEAPRAYEELKGGDRPLTAVLEYPVDEGKAPVATRMPNPKVSPGRSADGRIRLALVGAGGFAKGMHLPNLQSLSDRYRLHAVISRTGANAQAMANQYEAAYCGTDVEQVLADDEVDAVLIATRHHLHGDLALRALQAGKHVLVEKPLALTAAETDAIEAFYRDRAEGPVLLTGFNRRFSPHARRIQSLLAGRSNPFIANYRMNAGHIPADHWVHGPEGGGRNLGEACHIYDLFTFFTGARVETVQAVPMRPATGFYRRDDNFTALLGFDDGSVCSLTYTALGSTEFPKETLEVFSDGRVLRLDDYKQTQIIGAPAKGVSTKMQDKGQRDELVAFADAVQGRSDWAIPLWQQLQATRVALDVQEQLQGAGLDNGDHGG